MGWRGRPDSPGPRATSSMGLLRAGERAVRGEDQADGGLAVGQRLLGDGSAGVRAHGQELAEDDLVCRLQALLAEGALRALGRAGEDRGLAGALRGEVGQRLETILVRRALGDGERV